VAVFTAVSVRQGVGMSVLKSDADGGHEKIEILDLDDRIEVELSGHEHAKVKLSLIKKVKQKSSGDVPADEGDGTRLGEKVILLNR
jgi:hypothetical protein